MNGQGRKQYIGVFGSAFTLVGAVMGAGFISGRELLDFFGGFYLFSVLLAGGCFFLCFYLFFCLGAKYGGFQGALQILPTFMQRAVRYGVLLGALFTSIGMLSAIRSALPLLNPVLPMVMVLLSVYIGEKGLGGLGKINGILTPAILLAVLILIWKNGSGSYPEKDLDAIGVVFPLFYVCLNAFFALPVLLDMGERFQTNKRVSVCLLTSVTIAFFIGVILCALASDKSSYSADLPLAAILGSGKTAFSLLACGGMATTLFSSFYPVYQTAKEMGGEWGKWGICLLTLLGSLIRFKKIVGVFYPLLSVIGVVVVIAFLLSGWIGKKEQGKEQEKEIKIK